MIVRTNENHGEYVIVNNYVTSLLTVVNGAMYAKGFPQADIYISDYSSIIVFFGYFMSSIKRR